MRSLSIGPEVTAMNFPAARSSPVVFHRPWAWIRARKDASHAHETASARAAARCHTADGNREPGKLLRVQAFVFNAFAEAD